MESYAATGRRDDLATLLKTLRDERPARRIVGGVVSVRAVVVAHRETLAAEGIAAALGRYPALVAIGVATSAAELERCAEGADAVAVDARIPGVEVSIGRLLKRGLRVVRMHDGPPATRTTT